MICGIFFLNQAFAVILKKAILFNRNYIVSNHVLDFTEMIAIGKCKIVKCVSRNMGSSNQRKQEEERRIENKKRENEEVF